MTEITRFMSYWQDPNARRRVLDARRKRYHEDPEFRASEIERVKRGRKSKAKPRGRKRGSPNKPKEVEIAGRRVVLVGLGEAAQRIGVSKSVLRTYDDQGIIPRNREIDGLGRRWYPEDFVEWLKPFLKDQSRKREPHWALQSRIEHAWPTAAVTRIEDAHDSVDRQAHPSDPDHGSTDGEDRFGSSGGPEFGSA